MQYARTFCPSCKRYTLHYGEHNALNCMSCERFDAMQEELRDLVTASEGKYSWSFHMMRKDIYE